MRMKCLLRRLLILISVLSALAVSPPVFAADNSWTSTVSGAWQTGGNWLAGIPPSNNFATIWITNATTKTITIDSNTATMAGVMTISNLTIFAPAATVNSLLLSNVNNGTTPQLRVLSGLTVGTNAVLLLTNSTLRVDGLSSGLFTVNGGTVTLRANSLLLTTNSSIDLGANLSLTGPNCTWNNTGNINFYANNQLTISAGASFTNGVATLGAGAATNTTVTVTGANSLWHNSGDLVVGNNGAGNQLTITNGATVFDSTGYVGFNTTSSNNTVLVTGTSSIWSNRGDLYVGYSGAGNQLTISNSATVYNDGGFLGFASSSSSPNGSNNTVLVTGTGSVWSNYWSLFVGGPGTASNHLTIINGGAVYNEDGYLGTGWVDSGTGELMTSSNNTVVVAGAGSVWGNRSRLLVGEDGADNHLTITNGATVYNGIGYLGRYWGSSNNAVLVTGTGSVWSNSSNLFVGDYGSGNRLTIANGGGVSNTTGYIGAEIGANNNAVTVTGFNSRWYNGGALCIGSNGVANTLTIGAYGRVDDSMGFIGCAPGASNNMVVVTGPGSIWNNSYDVFVGQWGSGNTLIITNGGVVRDNNGLISACYGSTNNTAIVSGAGSCWDNANWFLVGSADSGNSLTIANGGTVSNASLGFIGFSASASNNNVTVTGAGSTWNCGDNLTVGHSGTGNQLTVANGGLVRARNVYLAANLGASGTLWLNGGTVATSNIFVNTGGTVTYDSGTFQLTGALTLNGGLLQVNGALTLGTGGVPVALNSGSILVSPTGILRLTSDLTTSASAVINQGILQAQAGVFTFAGGFDNQANFSLNPGQAITINNGLGNEGFLTLSAGAALTADSFTGNTHTGNLFLNSGAGFTVNSAWTNAGAVSLLGGVIVGSTVHNTSLIEGTGGILAPLINANGGTVRASGGLLTVSGTSIQNQTGGVFEAVAGATLRVNRPLTNQGIINNRGGDIDLASNTLTNQGTLTGYGGFKAGQTINTAHALFTGGNINYYGNYINDGAGATTEVKYVTANFYGSVTNNGGYMKITGSQVNFLNTTYINGPYVSDPATNTFTATLTLGPGGALEGGEGDLFVIGASLISANPNGLNLPAAALLFSGAGIHNFTLAGTAYLGALEVASGNSLLLDGGDVYVGAVEADPAQFTTDQTIYYDPAKNPSLNGQTIALNGGGTMQAIPEPSTALLVLAGIATLWRATLRRGRTPNGRDGARPSKSQ